MPSLKAARESPRVRQQRRETVWCSRRNIFSSACSRVTEWLPGRSNWKREREKQTKTAWNVISWIYLSLSKCPQTQQGEISACGRLDFGWNKLDVKSDERLGSKVYSVHVFSNTLSSASFKLPMTSSLLSWPKPSQASLYACCVQLLKARVLVVLFPIVKIEAFLIDLHRRQRAVEKQRALWCFFLNCCVTLSSVHPSTHCHPSSYQSTHLQWLGSKQRETPQSRAVSDHPVLDSG